MLSPLIELVVTMVLIGILAAVALPRFFDATAFHSRGFYDEVIQAARYGQKLAVASGCDVELSIAGGSFALASTGRQLYQWCIYPGGAQACGQRCIFRHGAFRGVAVGNGVIYHF